MDVRGALLQATTKVFAEFGMRGATTRRIARAAGVNEVTLFRHFKNKEDLFQAALETFARRSQTRALPEQPNHPREELVKWCRTQYRDLYKHRALIRKAMGEHEEHPAHCARGLEASVRIAEELAAYLTRLKDAKLASGAWDPRAATNMLMGAIFTDAMGRDTMPERYPYSARSAVDRYVDLLLLAIGVPPETTPARGQSA